MTQDKMPEEIFISELDWVATAEFNLGQTRYIRADIHKRAVAAHRPPYIVDDNGVLNTMQGAAQKWPPKEKFEQEGMRVIAWLSTDKGFKDITATLLYEGGNWCWDESGDTVKKPDLIKGVIPYPEPPEEK